jgi:histidine triad (HIT) family protein
MTDCIFCRIINNEIPARKVCEDDFTVAFYDANPASPLHILIVPRDHVSTLNDISDEDQIFSRMGMAARKIARELGVADSGYRFFVNVNRGGGQVVFHLHAHLIAGNDLGTWIINGAIACSILRRKLVGLFRRK